VFTLVWIAWANGSLHYELHGREDARSRITFLVQILVLAVMGACIPAASGARGAAFAVATAVLFAILAGLWLRAGRGDRPEYRRSSRLYVAGTAAFAVLMACAALLPASARVPAWGLLDAAYLAVFGAVILTARAGASLIVTDALIERFGTLTIIVLGEILTSAVAGLASQPLSGLTLSVGLVAVVVGFARGGRASTSPGSASPGPRGRPRHCGCSATCPSRPPSLPWEPQWPPSLTTPHDSRTGGNIRVTEQVTITTASRRHGETGPRSRAGRRRQRGRRG
jgi:hypothetical protein